MTLTLLTRWTRRVREQSSRERQQRTIPQSSSAVRPFLLTRRCLSFGPHNIAAAITLCRYIQGRYLSPVSLSQHCCLSHRSQARCLCLSLCLRNITAADHIVDIVDISRLDICVLCMRLHRIDLQIWCLLSQHFPSQCPRHRSGAMVHGAAPRCALCQSEPVFTSSSLMETTCTVSCLIKGSREMVIIVHGFPISWIF